MNVQSKFFPRPTSMDCLRKLNILNQVRFEFHFSSKQLQSLYLGLCGLTKFKMHFQALTLTLRCTGGKKKHGIFKSSIPNTYTFKKHIIGLDHFKNLSLTCIQVPLHCTQSTKYDIITPTQSTNEKFGIKLNKQLTNSLDSGLTGLSERQI